MNGLTGVVANLYNAFEPDLKITRAQGKYFDSGDSLVAKLQQVKGVKYVSLSLSDKALVKNSDKQALVTVKGVDENFAKVTFIDSAITAGSFIPAGNSGAFLVMGRGVANQLQAGLSEFASELSLFSPARGKEESLNPEENFNQVYCRPHGIFSLNDEFDFQYVFVSLKTARLLFDTEKGASAIEIACEKGMTDEVQQALSEQLGSDFLIKNRYQLNDVLFKSLETEKLATFIILAFILVIATFNIIGALTMLIIEKKKDLKTLYHLGASQGLIRSIFMREGFLITGIGAIAGLLLGLGVCWLQLEFHLVKFGSEFIIPYYPIELQWQDFIWIACLIMLIGFFAALYPVRVFTRIDLVR